MSENIQNRQTKTRHACYVCRFFPKSMTIGVDATYNYAKPTGQPGQPPFHCFPKRQPLRTMWMQICKVDPKLDCVDNVLICSLHFNPCDYCPGEKKRKRLRVGVVPSINIPRTPKELEIIIASSADMKNNKNMALGVENRNANKNTTRLQELPVSSSPQPKRRKQSDTSRKLLPKGQGTTTTYPVYPVLYVCNEQVITTMPQALSDVTTHVSSVVSGIGDTEITTEKEPPSEEELKRPQTNQPKRKKVFAVPRHIGDLDVEHFSTPERANATIQFIKEKVRRKDRLIRTLQQTKRRFFKKIKTMQDLLDHLKKEDLISAEAAEMLATTVPDELQELIKRKLCNKRNAQYTPELRRFALTLSFYSSRAYNYIRKCWGNLLPSESTLRKWYSAADEKPYFTKESLDAIKHCSDEAIECNIVMEQINFKEEITYDEKQFYAAVNVGTDVPDDSDERQKAKSVDGCCAKWELETTAGMLNI